MKRSSKRRPNDERYVWKQKDIQRLNKQIFSGMSIFYDDYSDHGLPIVSISNHHEFIPNHSRPPVVTCRRAISEFTIEEIKNIEDELIDGVDRKYICDKYNIKIKTLKNKCKRMGLEWGVNSSTAHPLRDRALQMLIDGFTVRQIEDELGITYHLIHRWKAKLKSEGRLS